MLTLPDTHRSDGGFTLIELLLSVAILGIIGAAIGSSFLVMLTTEQRTNDMLAVSRDRQFVSNYFSDDASGAVTMSEGAQSVCGSSLTALVVFTGRDTDPGTSSTVPTTVAWSYQSGPSAGRLLRTACRGGGPADVRIVARNVSATVPPTVRASCTSSTTVTSAPTAPQVLLTVAQATGGPLRLCALRRSE